MAKQIEPGLYKTEWTEEERKDMYSLSDTEIEEAMSISRVETAKIAGEAGKSDNGEGDEGSE